MKEGMQGAKERWQVKERTTKPSKGLGRAE
jgi:hypothetical protein